MPIDEELQHIDDARLVMEQRVSSISLQLEKAKAERKKTSGLSSNHPLRVLQAQEERELEHKWRDAIDEMDSGNAQLYAEAREIAFSDGMQPLYTGGSIHYPVTHAKDISKLIDAVVSDVGKTSEAKVADSKATFYRIAKELATNLALGAYREWYPTLRTEKEVKKAFNRMRTPIRRAQERIIGDLGYLFSSDNILRDNLKERGGEQLIQQYLSNLALTHLAFFRAVMNQKEERRQRVDYFYNKNPRVEKGVVRGEKKAHQLGVVRDGEDWGFFTGYGGGDYWVWFPEHSSRVISHRYFHPASTLRADEEGKGSIETDGKSPKSRNRGLDALLENVDYSSMDESSLGYVERVKRIEANQDKIVSKLSKLHRKPSYRPEAVRVAKHYAPIMDLKHACLLGRIVEGLEVRVGTSGLEQYHQDWQSATWELQSYLLSKLQPDTIVTVQANDGKRNMSTEMFPSDSLPDLEWLTPKNGHLTIKVDTYTPIGKSAYGLEFRLVHVSEKQGNFPETNQDKYQLVGKPVQS